MSEFLNGFKIIHSSKKHPVNFDEISVFFQKFKELHTFVSEKPAAPEIISLKKLKDFFNSLKEPIEKSRYSAIDFDPWDIIQLKRSEVRIVKILAWLLDPQGSHGLGYTLQNALLKKIGENFSKLTDTPCRVIPESTLNGDIGDRVDIEIVAQRFYLLIEAKIDAIDQENQLTRYCRQAKKRSAQFGGYKEHPWSVVYLTLDGRRSSSSDPQDAERIFSLSWKQLSDLFLEKLCDHQKNRRQVPIPLQNHADFFTSTYLNYIHSL